MNDDSPQRMQHDIGRIMDSMLDNRSAVLSEEWQALNRASDLAHNLTETLEELTLLLKKSCKEPPPIDSDVTEAANILEDICYMIDAQIKWFRDADTYEFDHYRFNGKRLKNRND